MKSQDFDLLHVARDNPRSPDLYETLLTPVIDEYVKHFDGNILAAQVALIEDMFVVTNLKDPHSCHHGSPPISVILAIKAMAG